MKHYFPLLLLLLAIAGCKPFTYPTYIPHYHVGLSQSFPTKDSVMIVIDNPLDVRIRVKVLSEQENEILKQANPIIVNPREKREVYFPFDSLEWANLDIGFNYNWYEVRLTDSLPELRVPFRSGKAYKIMQGYHGSFSHNSDYSRYALDFTIPVGDTVNAAWDGYVVGVTQGHSRGGNDRRLRDYSNFVTIYHPDYGVYTQYVHIMKDGALVEIGDTVSMGQAVGLSGLVGFTSAPHLHFNVVAKDSFDQKLKSIPAKFGKTLKGSDMKKGILIRRK
ncbi:MAG: M23 family metallopeptidase [Bacteroidota bacterium]